ncbi:MAG: TonB-dependent receptor [Proteobacteria bacterium]|jgi:iron complex outermembrane recepter protein|nr:TonB-dependent receptor [Pseudomonadota bacterium]
MNKFMNRLAMAALGGAILSTTMVVQAALEEIVVVAQKREQSMQDVPVAITALSGAQLAELGITDVFDLQQSTPGLIVEQNQTATTSNFSIRGVGTSGQNFGLESSVGLYVDGVYQSRQSSIINEMVDVKRVEVLRGPQGTLFGRNTPSGAVLLQTVAPDHETTGFIEATAGNKSLRSISAAVGGSLVEDVLAFRLTGYSTDRDGYVDALGIEDDVINDRDRLGVRAQLLYTPNDAVSVRLIADYSEIDDVCCGAATVRNNFFAFNGAPLSDSLLTLLGVPPVSENQVFDDVVRVNQLPVSQNENSGVSAEINWDLDNGGTFTSITSLRSFDSVDVTDVDFSAAQLFNNTRTGESDVFTQEIRFTNNGDKLNYIVGAYYYNQNLDSTSSFDLGPTFNPLLLANPDLAAIVGGLNGLSALTRGAFPRVAAPFGPNAFSHDEFQQDQEAWAIFGQLDYRLTEKLTLTAGLRFTDESKDVNGVFTQSAVGSAADFTAIGTNLVLAGLGLAAPNPALFAPMYRPGWGHSAVPIIAPRPDVAATLEDDQITGTIKLSWFANDTSMLYASYGTGYKSGGTNTDRILVTQSQLFDAETSESFELGIKTEFPNQNLRLNAALYLTTFDDFQTNSFAGGGFNLSNAGEMEAKGLEVELYWAPTDDLVLNAGYAYNDATFKTHERANCWIATPLQTGQADPGDSGGGFCGRSGDRVRANPEHFFTIAATKTFAVGNSMSAYLHADYNYRSNQFQDGNADPIKLQDGYGLLNASLGVVLEESDINIKLWARNLLDKDYLGSYFDAPLQDGKVNAYIREPHTFGLTVRKNF